MGEEQQVQRENQIFSIRYEWWFALINLIFNKIGEQFLKSIAFGLLNWLALWKPAIEVAKLRRFCNQGRVNNKMIEFGCPLSTFFCNWIKNSFLNFITLTLYGACGGNKKYQLFLDSWMCYTGGEGKGLFKWFTAEPGGLRNFLSLMGLLCSAFTMHPFLSMWVKKGWLNNCRFGLYGLHLNEAKYCAYAKIYYCKCGVFCAGKLDNYLDDNLKAQTLTEAVQVAAANVVAAA